MLGSDVPAAQGERDMAITWQTRGEGRFTHRFHAITLEQSAALAAPTEVGVHQVEIDGSAAFALAVPTPRLRGRPLRWGAVAYATHNDAETHAEAWLTRDRDAFYDQIEAEAAP